MNRMILMLLLAVVSSNAMAEWVALGRSNDGDALYADPATIQKNDSKATMWSLLDLKTVETRFGNSYLSQKNQAEYDCKEEQFRILGSYFFTGHMADGNAVPAIPTPIPDKSAAIPTGSAVEVLWKFACGKK